MNVVLNIILYSLKIIRMFGNSHSSLKVTHNLLKRLAIREIAPYQEIDGWLTYDEATALYLVTTLLLPDSTVIEIGSWKGKSTYCIAKALKGNGQVIAIGPFDASVDPDSLEVYQSQKGLAATHHVAQMLVPQFKR